MDMEVKWEREDEYGLVITECTLELQRLAGGKLPQLTRRQSELVALELQGHRGLWLGNTTLPNQLSNLHYISTFSRKQLMLNDSTKWLTFYLWERKNILVSFGVSTESDMHNHSVLNRKNDTFSSNKKPETNQLKPDWFV